MAGFTLVAMAVAFTVLLALVAVTVTILLATFPLFLATTGALSVGVLVAALLVFVFHSLD